MLDLLAASPALSLVGVVTAPPRPAGRGARVRPSPIAERAARLEGVPILTPRRLREPQSVEAVVALSPELIVVADYGQIVPPALLDLPAFGALNLHPSLLPRHRGATPVPSAILAGDAETGVTLMLMDEGIDSGPILAQRRHRLHGDETADELEAALAAEAAELLREQLPSWLEGALVARPQPADGVTLTRPLRREDGRLDPCTGAVDLERRVRAYQPWPGTFLETAVGRLIVWRTSVLAGVAPEAIPSGPTPPEGARVEASARVDGPAGSAPVAPDDAVSVAPGTFAAAGEGLALRVVDGWLRLDEVQPAGGRRMPGDALRRGRPGLVGSRVERMAVGCAPE